MTTIVIVWESHIHSNIITLVHGADALKLMLNMQPPAMPSCSLICSRCFPPGTT
jgi:hypothetical protein